MIDTTKDLEEACRTLAQAKFVTVDTEFLRENTFWPQLCLIQMACPGFEVIVDPLCKDINLQPFFELMANEKVMKVFHAARQDIEIIFHLGNVIPAPLFDTQVAAMVCGLGDSISYEQIVQRLTGGKIDKSSRFTDWRRRPLSQKQLTYAIADVTHLRDVYISLSAQLEKEGRTSWLDEEMHILCNPETYDIQPKDAWRRVKLRVKKPTELAVLQNVAAWRENEARSRDVPRGRILKDDAILEIAQQQPRDEESLGHLRGIPKNFERSKGAAGLLEAIDAACQIPRELLPAVPKSSPLPEGCVAAIELLRVLLKLVAEERGVAAKVIASSDDLEQLAVNTTEANIGALKGWRRILFGEQALKLLSGEIALCYKNKKVNIIKIEPRENRGTQ